MLEVEVKCPVADFAEVRQRLEAWGARAEGPRQEADHYFNAPDRDFARTDEALRLRRVGSRNWITYKGPRRDQMTKTRTEIEVPLADGDAAADDLCHVLEHLGYRPVAVVRKERIVYHCQREGYTAEVTLDEVAEVGRFVEAEIQAPESELAKARDVLLRLIADLGLRETERRSYLEMLLARGTGL
jgi:adenylate cyclase class 2